MWLATAPTDQRPGAAVVGEQGVVAARFAPRGADTDVEIVADDPASHPFRTYAACRSVHVSRGAGEASGPPVALQRVSRDRITRAAGEVVRFRAHVYLVEPGRAFQPVIVERWARGARAAVVFADHADRTDPEALAALLHGVSDRAAPEFGRAGFFAHHIKITKTFFLRPGLGTLEDPDTRRLADELAAHGSEVGSHSISPLRDLRADVMASLGGLAPWKVVTWIDHQPDTNCEAISSRGWRDDPTYGIHDVLAAAGFRWVWSASDVPLHAIQVRNLFEPERAAAALPPIYPLPGDARLWVFESSWFYGPTERMATAFSDAELDRLEDSARPVRRTHLPVRLAPHHAPPRPHRARRGGPARPGRPGHRSRHRVGARPAGGPRRRGRARQPDRPREQPAPARPGRRRGALPPGRRGPVSNLGSRRIDGLTLALPASVEPEVNGAAVGGVRSELGRTTLWIDLPAGATVAVTARWPAVPGKAGGERAPRWGPRRRPARRCSRDPPARAGRRRAARRRLAGFRSSSATAAPPGRSSAT